MHQSTRKITWALAALALVFSSAAAIAAPIADRAARIAIIGGGVAGLSTAVELTRRGYRDLTVFEAGAEPGGKVLSVRTADGNVHELGAIVQSDDFQAIQRLASITGYSRSESDWRTAFPRRTLVVSAAGQPVSSFLGYRGPVGLDPHNIAAGRRYGTGDVLRALPGLVRMRAGAAGLRDLSAPGFDGLLAWAGAPGSRHHQDYLDLLEPTDRYFADKAGAPRPADLRAALGPISLFFNMTGYGFTSEVPALYHMKFFPLVADVGNEQGMGLAPMTTATRGYQDLFRHVAAWLAQRGVSVRLAHRVTRVTRPANALWEPSLAGTRGVEVAFEAAGGAAASERYDALVVAVPPDAARRFLDEDARERRLLDATRTYDFVTTLLEDRDGTLAGWRDSTVFVEDHALDAAGTVQGGHVIGVYNNDGSRTFTAYSFAPADGSRSDAEVRAQVLADLAALGRPVRPDAILITRQWKNYFPHFSTDTLKSDPESRGRPGAFLPALTALQGTRATLYAMAIFDFESTEHLAGYARALVERHFAE